MSFEVVAQQWYICSYGPIWGCLARRKWWEKVFGVYNYTKIQLCDAQEFVDLCNQFYLIYGFSCSKHLCRRNRFWRSLGKMRSPSNSMQIISMCQRSNQQSTDISKQAIIGKPSSIWKYGNSALMGSSRHWLRECGDSSILLGDFQHSALLDEVMHSGSPFCFLQMTGRDGG